ncbi:MAG: LamG-like jellyroll fold domain-containing protein [Casimicrobium sp.]
MNTSTSGSSFDPQPRSTSVATRAANIVTRRFGATLAALVGAVSLASAQPVPEILHYKFNETGTSVTNNASAPPVGTATGTINGGITQNATMGTTALKAAVGSGVSSTSDYINTGWATSLSGSWSISFFTSDIGPSSTLFYIMGDVNASSFRIFTNGVAGANNWILRMTGMTDVLLTGAVGPTPAMATFVYDSTANEIRAYKDGVLLNTVAQGAGLAVSGTGPFKVIGYSANVGLNAGGKLADVRIYSKALSQTEITAIYDARLLLPQTITFGTAPTVVVNGTGNVSATSATPNSGNTITYSTTSTDCSVTAAGVVTGIHAGTNNCVITATQAANATYDVGTATQTFNIGKANQTLTLTAQSPASRVFAAGATFAVNPVATSASPNSGVAIVYSSLTTGVCTVGGTVVTMVSVGTCTIAADQAGDADYNAATQVSQNVQLLGSGTVGGTVSGLAGTGLVLSLNSGAQTVSVPTNGGFTFPSAITAGNAYAVTVQTQPSAPGQTCVVANGNGTMGNSAVTNVNVTCTTNTFAVSVNLGIGVAASPAGPQNITQGSTLSITLTPQNGFSIIGASGCGGSLVGNVFTTGPINGACTITVATVADSIPVPTLGAWLQLLLAGLLFAGAGVYLTKSRRA